MLLRASFCCVVAILFSVETAAAGDVKVVGVTYLIDNDGKYHTLDKITIQAYRNDAPLLQNAITSGPKGQFEFSVPEGAPFDVVFSGQGKVPEINQLAGQANVKIELHVALLSTKQYESSAKGQRVTLQQKVRCLVEQMPREDRLAIMIRQQFGLDR